MKRYFFALCLAWSFAPAAPEASAAGAPAEGGAGIGFYLRFVSAYEVMRTADTLAAEGMNEDALTLYRRAVEEYSAILRDYPGREGELLNYRVNYCMRRVAESDAFREARPASKGAVGRSAEAQAAGAAAEVAGFSPAASAPARPPSGEALGAALQLEGEGRFEEGLERYRGLLKEEPGSLEAVKGAARCLMELGRADAAGEMLLSAIEPDAPDADILFMLAVLYCRGGKYDKAEYILRQLAERAPGNAAARLLLGVALAALGETGAAEEEFRAVISIAPETGTAYYNLARLMMRKKPQDLGAAQEFYKQALSRGAAADQDFERLIFAPK